MNIKKGKSLIAFVLIVAMLLTVIPIGNRVMAAETTDLGNLTMALNSVTNNNFYFRGKLASGTSLTNGKYYRGLATIETDTETVTQNITLGIGNNNSITVYSGFFSWNNQNNKIPTKSFKIAADTIFTEVYHDGSWKETLEGETPTTFTVSKEFSIVNNNGTWETVKEELGNLTMALDRVTNNNFYFVGSLASGTSLTNGKYYRGLATIETDTETVTQNITLGIGNNNSIIVYSGFFTWNNQNNKIPTKSFKIAADTIFTEVYNDGSWKETLEGKTPTTFTVAEELNIVNVNGTWKVKREQVSLEFVSGVTGDKFYFVGTLSDGSYLPVGNYKVPATIVHDGGSVTKDIVVEVTEKNPDRITIWNTHFNWVPGNGSTPPTKSLTFAKDAIFTPVQYNSGWSEVENGKSYELSEEIIVVNNNEQWMDNSVLEGISSITLRYNKVDSNNNFYFVGALADSLTLTAGYYKVGATIDGSAETKDVVAEISADGTFIIYWNFFSAKPGSNYTTPTKSLKLAKNAIFTQVNSSGWEVMENGQIYKLGQEFHVQTNEYGLWDWSRETNDLGSLAMTLNKVEDKHTYLVGTFQNGGTLTSGDYYKGVATIETDSGKETKFITLGIGANNAINIYNGFYTWNNNAGNTPPTKSFKIAAGTTFRQVYADPWREVSADETPTSFTVASDLSLVCIDGTWYAESITGDANGDGVMNVCDLVRYVKYNKDSVNTKISTGADINGNNIYDDIDKLRKLLVGEDIPVATYFNLVQNGASDYTIVTPANATTNEVVAANELQYFIQESTGATLTIANETDSLTADSGKYIYVGDTKAAEEASVTLASSAQKKNGYLIKTVADDCYLRGYSDIGTKNAVYEFLDHSFDYEYYAVDEIYLTKTFNVKLLDYNLEATPDFEWRLAPNGEVIYAADGSFATSSTGVIANRMRFNLASDIFVTKYDFHNGYTILPPATYLELHPDWYSRDIEDNTITYTSDAGTLPAQLCYSSASMREQFTIELLELLEATTVANVMLGQQDTKYWCECEACSAAKEKYGTNAAVLVQFANTVQADVNTWFAENRPDETPTRMVIFAYQSTSQPAVKWDEQSESWTAIDKTVILNEDSSVMFAIGDMQMHVPFAETDPSSLATPYGRILGWEACSDSMFAWTYSLYMNHGLLFSNTIDVMAQNYRLLAEHGVTMIQEQADSYQKYKNSGFSRLETYLMSKMQWDTSLNQEQLIDDFFANYFGEAADTMQTLFNLERKNILAKYEDESIGFKGTFGEDVLTTDFWPQDELEAYQALIQQAYSDIASLEATDAERYAKLYERIQLEGMQFGYIDCSLHNTDIESRNEFKNNFEQLGMYSYAEHKSINTLWKEWGIQYGQVMSYSYVSPTANGDSFNFVLHKGAMPGWYQAQAYIDGTLSPVMIEVTGSNSTSASAWIYWHCFNDNISANTTKQPTTSLVIRPGTILKPVVTNSWSQQDMSRPAYILDSELYITKTEDVWVAGNMISTMPTSVTMSFDYTSDKNQNGKFDFAFLVNQTITSGWYKADTIIDGKEQSVLLQVINMTDGSSRVWIYEGCFNENAKLSDSVLPQSTFVITKGTVLSPVIASKYTVDSERIGYQLTQELNITNTNGTWQ